MKKHNYKYDVIRIVLTVLVVIGHANYYNAGNAYGGIYIADRNYSAPHLEYIDFWAKRRK